MADTTASGKVASDPAIPQLPNAVLVNGHLVRIDDIVHASQYGEENEPWVHVDYRYGGFTNIKGLTLEGLLSLINGSPF